MKINNPVVSVVMSVFNSENYLDEAIKSVLCQTLQDFEFIIINDGSTDSSLSIIKHYMTKDNRIKLIDRENKGLAFSLNQGIQMAKGIYIARMDADDIALPDRLNQQVSIMEMNSSIDVCGSWAKQVGKNNVLKQPTSHQLLIAKLFYSVCFIHPTVVIRKSIFNNFSYNEDYSVAQDYELWNKIFENNTFYNIPEVLLEYRVTSGNITNSSSDDKRFRLLKEIYRQQFSYYGLECDDDTLAIHYALAVNQRSKKSHLSWLRVNAYLKLLLNHSSLPYLVKHEVLRKYAIYLYFSFQRRPMSTLINAKYKKLSIFVFKTLTRKIKNHV